MSTTTTSPRLNGEAVFWISLLHVGALAAIPFFTWKALAVCFILLFTVSPIGVNLTYHRLLSHRAFKTPKWFEYVLVTIGAFSAQGPVIQWVAGHRYHHRYSDQKDKDLHTPTRGGFWGSHILHLFYHSDFFESDNWKKYVPDLTSDPYMQFLSKYNLQISLLNLPLLYWWGGMPYLMWGGFVRVLLMLHFTWFVNSASHIWGYRNFHTKDQSKNCWWVGIIAAGEGWHNNHHAQPSSAAHGMKWWEFDLTFMYIRLFEFLGLIYDVKRPDYQRLQARVAEVEA